jgi:mannose-1-phosphate guanylyltransferase/mannose-6-phosphate isomerase
MNPDTEKTKTLNDVYVVILAGGSGTRFWPLSRETCPKQMLQIVGEDSLLRQTIKRVDGLLPPENIWIVTTEDMALDIRFHLESFGELAKKINFIKEPIGKNTAPAIGLTAIYLNHLFPQSVMTVMPSDHAIPDREDFLRDLKLALQGAREDYLVTFGIKPSRPETGYGYIKLADASNIGRKGLHKVECFAEKPDLETAKKYFSNGSYYWNSGIFTWKTSKILSEIEKYLPDLYKGLKEIEALLFEPNQPNEFNKTETRSALCAMRYASLQPLSIDYGIMERSHDVLMVPATFRWSDLGSWSALDEIIEKDNEGNILKGNTVDVGSQGSTIYGGERLIATIGLKDMVVVDTPDATLVTPKERVQEVRKIVEVLKRNGREERLLHKTVERPWGSYTVLEKGEGYKIKRVVLKPGAKLSVQLHRKRSEHWVVVTGTARVTKENDSYLVHSNESTYIPIGVKHRLENLGEIPLQVIEVQNGQYLEEDDIERFDDIYGRT